MPFSVLDIVQDNPPPLTSRIDQSIQSVLPQMIDHDYTQLPVVDENNIPLGMVTYESILRAINNLGVPLTSLCVRDVLQNRVSKFRQDADLFEILDRVRDEYAVLIVDGKRALRGIVTNFDITEYFRRRAEDMMLIEDVETLVKEFILLSFTNEQGEVDETALNETIKRINGRSRSFDRMSLNNYIRLFVDKERWHLYESVFSMDREVISSLLHNVRQSRNRLAHFERELSDQERDQLRYCSEWLGRHQDALTELFQPDADPQTDSTKQPNEVAELDEATLEAINEEIQPTDSRYAPFSVWLQQLPLEQDVINLSIKQIEEMIDGSLPASAYKHRSWWSNEPTHSQSQAWLDAGWRTGAVNTARQQVRFFRIKEREKAYLEFFSALLNNLKDHPEVPIQNIQPYTQNYQFLKRIFNSPGDLSFYATFSTGKRFRIELYIDTGDRESNKHIFDLIQSQQGEVEQEIGESLSWERLDNRRASRIALYRSGSIDNDEQTLTDIRAWTVRFWPRVFKAMSERAAQAAVDVYVK